MRRVVLGFHAGRRGRQRRLGVALVALGRAGPAHRLQQRLLVRRRIVIGVGAVLPFDAQQVARLQRRPTVVGDHGQAAQRPVIRRRHGRRDLDHPLHAGHRQGRVGGVGLDLAEHHR
ncbi:MAG: hypothetical protein MUE63_15685, partial [Xanthomonadales bacterium]|nr:hypothetical protein [Xanthomonadales bacterium]